VQVSGHIKVYIDTSGGILEPLTACVLAGWPDRGTSFRPQQCVSELFPEGENQGDQRDRDDQELKQHH
jgi:hypothetical protein